MLARATAVTVTLFLAGTTASAQMPGMQGQSPETMPDIRGQQMMMGGMTGEGMMGAGMMRLMGQGMGMMATGGPGPAMILRMQETLGLNDEQVSRIRAIRADLLATEHRLMEPAMAAHEAARKALEADPPDFDAYADALSEVSDDMVEAHVAMARAGVEARSVLTPEQRERLQDGMGMMQKMMGGPGGGMDGASGHGHGAPGMREDGAVPHGGGQMPMPHGGRTPR